VLAVVLGSTGVTTALADPGDVDPTFSDDGLFLHDFNGDHDRARAMALTSGGKIVLAGYVVNGSTRDMAFARLTAEGDPDTTFSGDGFLKVGFGSGSFDSLLGVAVLGNGKIIGVGYTGAEGAGKMAIVKLLANGTLDTTFSTDGKVVVGIPNYTEVIPHDVVVQSNGRIVVFGEAFNGQWDAFLARFRANGAIDTTYSGDGRLIVGDNAHDEVASDGMRLSSGKMLFAGRSATGDDGRFFVGRVNTNGTLDTAFSGDGKVIVNMVPGLDDFAIGIARRPDGKLMVGGDANDGVAPGTEEDLAVLRLKENGAVDTTFGDAGKVFVDFGANEQVNGMLRAPDGDLVFSGYTLDVDDYQLAAYRLLGSGAPDPSFGVGGQAIIPFGTTALACFGYDVVRQADGKILVAGNFGQGFDDFAAARLEG
jgi:uncharacterized delta-60 repeat protein